MIKNNPILKIILSYVSLASIHWAGIDKLNEVSNDWRNWMETEIKWIIVVRSSEE